MYKLHYPRLIGSMHKEPLILKVFFYSGIYPAEPLLNLNILANSKWKSKIFWGMIQGPI
jgi:hypothetical protein